MRIFYDTPRNSVRLCWLSFLAITVIIFLFAIQGESGDFPSNDEIPASIYGDSHGDKFWTSSNFGNIFASKTYAHSHALAYAHSTRRGFYKVEAYTGPAGMNWFPIVSKRKDEDSRYFSNGCRAIANISDSYHLIATDDVVWIASYRIWDQTGAKIGQVNYQGLGYSLEEAMNVPDGDSGDAGGSHNIRLASITGYEAVPGTTHEASITTDVPYYSIIWGITSPGQTDPDIVAETDHGDGTTTEATLSYTFSSDSELGEYVISAYVFLNDLTLVTESYNVNLKNNASTDTIDQGEGTNDEDEGTDISDPTPTPGLTPANDSNLAVGGETYELQLVAEENYYYVHWYVKSPSETGIGTEIEYDGDGYGGESEASFSYTFPYTTGDYVITARVYRFSDYTYYDETYTVTVW